MVEPAPAAGERFGGSFESGKCIVIGQLLVRNGADFIDALLGLKDTRFYVDLYLFRDQLRPGNVEVLSEEGMIGHEQ